MNTDPTRLLSQSDLTVSERNALEAAELGVGAEYDFVRGEARLLAGLAALPKQGVPGQSSLGHPGARASNGVLGKLGLKILLGFTLGLALMGTAYVLSARSAPRSPARGPALTKPSVAEGALAPRPVVTSLAPSEPTLESAPAVRQESRRSDTRRRRITEAPGGALSQDGEPSKPVPETPVDSSLEAATDPRAELRAIAQAKALSARDPQAALRLLEQIRVQFPRGYFEEERAALAILALTRSGQSGVARQQASGFLERYPNGPHSDRIRRAIAAPYTSDTVGSRQ